MDFIALVSGGKDSIYTVCKLIDSGNRLVALIHMRSSDSYADSYMYQTVGTEIAEFLEECLGVPLYVFTTKCKTTNLDLEYSKSIDDEVEDLHEAISTVLKNHSFQAVAAGAVASRYQKNRIENVCARLGLATLSPLWKRDQRDLLCEMIDYGMDARIVKVASELLGKECLNMNLGEIKDYMEKKGSKYEMNYCGEGGEYESIVLDCKHFKKRLNVGSVEIRGHPEENENNGKVYYLLLHELSTVDK